VSTEKQSRAAEDLSRLYREIILQHAAQPVGYHKAIEETCSNEQFNPLCGDRVIIQLQVKDQIIQDAAFSGESCAICKASASLLCELIPGGSVEDFRAVHSWLEHSLVSGEETDGPEVLKALLGVRKFPARIKCATLPWIAGSEALS
jgi:nitrogen fixation NifU-like protein